MMNLTKPNITSRRKVGHRGRGKEVQFTTSKESDLFQPGDLVLCQYDGYPIWPAMITKAEDGVHEGLFRTKLPTSHGEVVESYQCFFFDDDTSGWIRADLIVRFHPVLLPYVRACLKTDPYASDQDNALALAQERYDDVFKGKTKGNLKYQCVNPLAQHTHSRDRRTVVNMLGQWLMLSRSDAKPPRMRMVDFDYDAMLKDGRKLPHVLRVNLAPYRDWPRVPLAPVNRDGTPFTHVSTPFCSASEDNDEDDGDDGDDGDDDDDVNVNVNVNGNCNGIGNVNGNGNGNGNGNVNGNGKGNGIGNVKGNGNGNGNGNVNGNGHGVSVNQLAQNTNTSIAGIKRHGWPHNARGKTNASHTPQSTLCATAQKRPVSCVPVERCQPSLDRARNSAAKRPRLMSEPSMSEAGSGSQSSMVSEKGKVTNCVSSREKKEKHSSVNLMDSDVLSRSSQTTQFQAPRVASNRLPDGSDGRRGFNVSTKGTRVVEIVDLT